MLEMRGMHCFRDTELVVANKGETLLLLIRVNNARKKLWKTCFFPINFLVERSNDRKETFLSFIKNKIENSSRILETLTRS